MEVLPASPPPMDKVPGSKKRRRSIEPLESSKIIGLPLAVLPDALRSVVLQQHPQQSQPQPNQQNDEPTQVTKEERPESVDDDEKDANDDNQRTEAASADAAAELMRRSLMGLSLQLKLKTMLVEAWASDMNSVVIERNLFAIAKELAILRELGVYEEATCVQFVALARQRMSQLLEETARNECLQMDAEQMWTMAVMQAREKMLGAPTTATSTTTVAAPAEFNTGFDSSSRDISVLWKAMSIARDRGAQLWHENKPEQALPFLVAADSYMKRFTLKYQRLKIDQAMLDTLHKSTYHTHHHQTTTPNNSSSSNNSSDPAKDAETPTGRPSGPKRVSFAAEPQVLGVADPDVDRSPISPTKPSKLESLLLRTSREFPTPAF